MKILLLSIAPVIIALLLQIPQSPSQPPAPRTGRTSSQNDKNKSPSKQAVAYHDDKQTNSISPTVDKPTAEVNSREKQADGTPEKGAPSVPGWLKASTVISAAATLLIAVLAGFQAWVIHKQRLAMDQQAQYMSDGLILTKQAADAATASAEIARQALILTQAADIHIDNVTANPDGRITKNTRLTVIVKNFGKTPASDLTTNLTLSAGDRHLVKIPLKPKRLLSWGPRNRKASSSNRSAASFRQKT